MPKNLLSHEHLYKHMFDIYLRNIELAAKKIMSPSTRKISAGNKHWLPQKKNDSTVNYHLLCWWEHGPYFMCSLIIPLSSYMWSLLIPLCLLYVEFTESTVYVLCGVYIFHYLCICGVYWVHCVCYTCKVYLFHCLCYMWSLPSPLSMLYVDFTYSTIFVCVEFTYSTIFVYVEFSYSICLLYM